MKLSMNKIVKEAEAKNTLIVDIDGTLCDIKQINQSYADLIPRSNIIEKLRKYQTKGYHILLFTSRNMRTYNSNIGLINKHTAPLYLV